MGVSIPSNVVILKKMRGIKMNRLRLIKDSIIYAYAVILWIILRPISIVIAAFNYILALFTVKFYRIFLILFSLALILGPDLIGGQHVLFYEGHINIARWIEYYSLRFANERNELLLFIVIELVVGLILSKLIYLINGACVFPVLVWIKDQFLRFSKVFARKRLVILEKDIRAVRDGGMYNIESFKKKYMYQ